MDAMMADLQSRVTDPAVIVAPLSFQRAIVAAATHKNPSVYSVKLLEEYKRALEGGKSKIYFPLHVNGNHWIAFMIDFVKRVFGFGDSMGRKGAADKFIPHLQKWLRLFGGTFNNLGDVLPHAKQRDYVHCGVYTTDCIQHELLNTPLISFTDCRRVRMEWFQRFVSNAADPSRKETPVLANHNFPALGFQDFFEQEPLTTSAQAVVTPSPSSQALGKIMNLPFFPDSPLIGSLTGSQIMPVGTSAAPPTPRVEENLKPPVEPSHQNINPGKLAADPPRTIALPPRKLTQPKRKRKPSEDEVESDGDPDDSDEERRRRKILAGNQRAKETKPRKAKTSEADRIALLVQDPYTVKLSPGVLKGTPHEIFCMCKPNRARKLDKAYGLKNWESHRQTCELKTLRKSGVRTKTVPTPVLPLAKPTAKGIGAFFTPLTSKSKSVLTPKTETPVTQTKTIIPANTRLDLNYFLGASRGKWTTRFPPAIVASDPVECLGLHGDGYREYAWQKGTSYIGGVSATEWHRIARALFPYKSWDAGSDSEGDSSQSESDMGQSEVMSEKVVHAACAINDAVELAMKGVKKETNRLRSRANWTDYERKRLHQSLVVAARWSTQPNTGSVYSRGCLSITTNLTGTCSSCTALAKLPGLRRAIRRASAKARLSPGDFTAQWKDKLKFTPRMLSDSSAADVKTALANPAVIKILSTKAMHGPGGAFLALFQHAQEGNLDDEQSFIAICDQFANRTERQREPRNSSEELHPEFNPTTNAPTVSTPVIPKPVHIHNSNADSDASSDCGVESELDHGSDSDSDCEFPLSLAHFEVEELNTRPVRRSRDAAVTPDAGSLGQQLSVSEALAHAAHHIITEDYLASEAAKAEAELEAIDKELDADPETPVAGRMLIANLLNPAPPKLLAPQPIPTFLPYGGGLVLRRTLVEQRKRHCAATRVNSEKTRKPETNVEYAGGKFSLNHAAHQLKEGLQQSEGLRSDTVFQKARYRRWIMAGPVKEWPVGCKLDAALAIEVPKIKSRGVDSLTPIQLGSLVMMRNRDRLYLGVVLGIYKYGSVSGKHESFTDAETVVGLSYLSLKVYEQVVPVGPGIHSISAGDNSWELWRALAADPAALAILHLDGAEEYSDDGEPDYEEPEEGSKKRRPKPPRGAPAGAKRQKVTAKRTRKPAAIKRAAGPLKRVSAGKAKSGGRGGRK
ncbi:hypothetical protein C8R46DRAFT_1040467 [Mycena filopes]|nr:hypothetical protein C8R46DRAFT_1040467 [Mycena filopes]